jgi:dienelactone hydrolase
VPQIGLITGMRLLLPWLLYLLLAVRSPAEIVPAEAALYLDFAKPAAPVTLHHGARRADVAGGVIEFTHALQWAETDARGLLADAKSASIGLWVYPKRAGEQSFLFRGMPEAGPQGERMFRPEKDWVKLLVGTDQRGFFLGSVHGNSRMPFPLVTLDSVGIDEWHQLVVTKDERGIQRFYRNGVLVHSDEHAMLAGEVRPFIETAAGEPLRLAVPLGGMIGEAWVFKRELSAAEIARDFETKRTRYQPALQPTRVTLRPMNAHDTAQPWGARMTADRWSSESDKIERAVRELIGPMPGEIPALEARIETADEDCGSYVRRKVSYQVQAGERAPAWLLIPKDSLLPRARAVPAIICMYGTTSGAGKDTTVGLSGAKPGSPPDRNRAFAVDLAEAGFVALAPDYLRDGERLPPSGRPYDTTDFYARHPGWSCVGKDIWDTQRAVDFLQSQPFVSRDQIGMMGHSYGGHTTIFAAALEPRIRCVFSSGPVSDFVHHGGHWSVPQGAGNSQSLPQLRPYVLDPTKQLLVTFYQWTALIAPRPLWVQQAVGERRPMEEENYAAVREVYSALGVPDRVRYMWQAGDHDLPPEARAAAIGWFNQWLRNGPR